MRKLNWDLSQITSKNQDGSFSTRAARSRILAQAANELHELGYRNLRARGLKAKHVEALVQHWTRRELSPGTIKNRMSHIRWWAEKVGKPGVVRTDNEAYGIVRREYVTNEDKSRRLDERLNAIKDPYTHASLRLQQAFGLRREESIKFSPSFAIQGDKLVLKSTWTKGGKEREIPILTEEQRDLLSHVTQLAGKGALIPPASRFIDQLKIYENAVSKAGFSKLHGLRHAYAQSRYETLTGWRSPVAGGPRRGDLDAERLAIDKQARMAISRELGHERLDVVAVYLGS